MKKYCTYCDFECVNYDTYHEECIIYGTDVLCGECIFGGHCPNCKNSYEVQAELRE